MSRKSKKKAAPTKAAAISSGAPIWLTSEVSEAADLRPPEPQIRPAVSGNRSTILGVCVFLATVVWIVFGQTWRYDFINYDDNVYVYENAAVTHGLTLKGVASAFSYRQSDNWVPLTTISHVLDCQLYGLNAGGHHLTNVLFHTVTAILLFLVLRQMTGFLWRSAFVAAVFAIHPLRVESVAWVAERKDVLSGMFFMLTIGAYVRYARRPWSSARYGLVVLLFALGLMCKPMLVTLPLVLLLLDYWPLNRLRADAAPEPVFRLMGRLVPRRLVFEKLPLLALAVASCGVTIFAQKEAIQPFENMPFPLRIENALISYVAYVGQMFWPLSLAVLYPITARSVGGSGVVPSLVLLAGISTVVFVLRARRPYLLVGWLWYLGMLVPVIGLFQVGTQTRADRYTYLPQIGLYLLLTWAAADLCAGSRHRRVALGVCSTIILAALIFCAHTQAGYWRNSESLWTHTLACTSDNFIAHNNLGAALIQNGKVNEAIAEWQKALEIKPNFADPYGSIGNALLQEGRVAEATTQFQIALQINPNDAASHNNLGNALLQEGRVAEAITQFQMALQINPDDLEARVNLGIALLLEQKTDDAIAQFKQALQTDPDIAEADYYLGNALLQKGDFSGALEHYQKVQPIELNNAEAHNNLGFALFQTGKMDEAIVQYQEALRIKPDYAEAHNNLGNALFRKGDVDEAIAQFQQALEIEPGNADANNNLAVILLQKGRVAEAIAYYQKAFQLKPDSPEFQNNLAWVLATASQASLRNGAQAVTLAQRANQLTGGNNPIILHTLAAAYAEAGRFDDAQQSAEQAIALARAAGQQGLVEHLTAELEFYKAGLPYHRGDK